MMNVGNPETAFAFGQLPNEGIGLARLEFDTWRTKIPERHADHLNNFGQPGPEKT